MNAAHPAGEIPAAAAQTGRQKHIRASAFPPQAAGAPFPPDVVHFHRKTIREHCEFCVDTACKRALLSL
jgi:hypothetical protein